MITKCPTDFTDTCKYDTVRKHVSRHIHTISATDMCSNNNNNNQGFVTKKRKNETQEHLNPKIFRFRSSLYNLV